MATVADFGIDADTSLIASQVVDAKRRLGKPAPAVVDLATAITEIVTFDTIRGSSTITLHVADPGYALLDSGFFDADGDGRLDIVEINYPNGSDLWWRQTQATINWGLSPTIQMVFMERTAAYLLDHTGPVKTSRAKKTRAEFLKMLCDRIKAGGGIQFISTDLHTKSKFAPDTPVQQKAAAKKVAKGQGLAYGDPSVKVKGTVASRSQTDLLERVLDVATHVSAGPKATLAIVEIVIVETDVSNPPCQNDGTGHYSIGIVQAGGGTSPASCPAYGRDVEKCVTFALQGGAPWVGHGGLIAIEKNNPGLTAGQMAQMAQSSAFPARYDQQEADAKGIIQAYGLGGGGSNVATAGATYRPQFNFEVGDINNPRETYWDAMNRLADEVKWPMFIDGPRVYFDPETTFIKQKPAAVITRGAPEVISGMSTWDVRNIATEFEITVICDPFEFRAGETLLLVGFGPCSTGSTVKFPGRWLISEIDRNETDIFSVLRLKQPEKPQPEPVNPLKTAVSAPGDSGGPVTGTPKQIIDTIVLPMSTAAGIPRTVAQNDAANATHGPTITGGRSDHQGPPSVAWAADVGNGVSTPEEAKLAAALAARFGISWSGSGLAQVTKGGYRYQLIHNTLIGGDHYNHVHFGVRVA